VRDKTWEFATPGIPDDRFVRGDVPMTKEEVRALILSKLRISEDHILYDIGAGTGTVSVEASLLAKRGRVYAIERRKEALRLLRENRERFDLQNLEIIEGEAPEALAGLPPPHRVFLGGSGGRLPAILEALSPRLKKGGILLLSAITLDTLLQGVAGLEAQGYRVEVTQIQVSRLERKGKARLFQALNPIFLIAGERFEA
jgi:precorrin-6Y C5,15-methyltransferase (decarboxylating) CbiT subunit